MQSVFSECKSLTNLELGDNFDTSSVTNMFNMFKELTNSVTIYAPNVFVTTNVANSDSMFWGCNNLVGGQGTVYDSSKRDAEYARIDGGPDNPGYFTDIADKQ